MIVRIFLIFVIFSQCSNSKEDVSVLGSWSIVEDGKYGKDNLSDSLIFYDNGIMKNYYLLDGKTVDSLVGKYSFDKIKRRLVTEHDSQRFEFKIVEISKNELVTQQIGSNVLTRFHRLN